MNIHEYQAKEVLRGFGVPTGKGIRGLHASMKRSRPPKRWAARSGW